MKLFAHAHATHPQWPMAAALVLAQLRAQLALPSHVDTPTLGLLYITDHYAGQAQAILDLFAAELPGVTDWAGTVGVGVAANNAEYFDEPALAVMLCALPAGSYRVFSGVAPLPASGFQPQAALVHADAGTPDVAELVAELAQRTTAGHLFGGLAASRTSTVQFAVGGEGNLPGQGAARGVFQGGLSGVALGPQVALVSRTTQGCVPVSPVREITACDGNLVLELDGEPALDVMLADLQTSLERPQQLMATLRTTLVGLLPPTRGTAVDMLRRTGDFGDGVVVRHLIGLDPARRGVAVADRIACGTRLAFCRRDVQAARADLMRICTEIREVLEPQEQPLVIAAELHASEAEAAPHPARRIAGAVYVSCAGRGGPHFGAPGAELQIVRRALGDVPLVGFFAGGEISGDQVLGYSGVLTVFTADAASAA
ncbi:MAG: FIST C-terminal domain-containing protein [Burkholderiaceae bacterium]|nr:FIST C-terminal domain-containing protein [Burkholderiaceae bacterium]